MGDAADLLLEGYLDEETGEYVGDLNELLYGEEAPGFPVSYRAHGFVKRTVECPHCGKLVAGGDRPLRQHYAAKHKGNK